MRPVSALSLAVILAATAALAEERGTHFVTTIHAPSLEDNPIGVSPDRLVSVWLPPGYDSTDRRYAVIYGLHGNSHTGRDGHFYFWYYTDLYGLGSSDPVNVIGEEFAALPDSDMIIIMPNSERTWYCNSPAFGDWEDFIVEDVVAWADTTFRTIPSRDSRGLIGHSMGGHGVLRLAFRHPDVFGAVYSLSPWAVGETGPYRSLDADVQDQWPRRWDWRDVAWDWDNTEGDQGDLFARHLFAAFGQNPDNPPSYYDFPAERNEDDVWVPVDSVMDRWWEFMPIGMIDSLRDGLLSLKVIGVVYGTSDAGYVQGRRFVDSLASKDIPHRYTEFFGGHYDSFAYLPDAMFAMDSVLYHGGYKASDEPTAVALDGLPRKAALTVAPNPFNATTRIRCTLPEAGTATLTLYDVNGRRVESLLSGDGLAAGDHDVTWGAVDGAGRPVGSGVYFALLETGGSRVVTRVTLLR